MKKIKLANYEVTKLMYGCMRIGNLSREDAKSQVLNAIDLGINFFDNADIYCNGVSEEYFGNAIKGIDRDKLVIQTKCGIIKGQGYYDFSKQHIVASVENSIKRMGIEYVDFLCLHRPDVLMDGYDVAQAFDELSNRGLVRHFGVSNFNSMQIELLKKYVDQPILTNQLQLGLFHTGMIDSGFCANMKNNWSADNDGMILPYCRLNDMTIQAWGPMRSKNGFFPNDESLYNENKILEGWANELGITKEALAIAWLEQMDIVQPIIGTTNVERLKDIVKADDVVLTKKQWYNIYKDVGNLIP